VGDEYWVDGKGEEAIEQEKIGSGKGEVWSLVSDER
jgi:hypothetical protein